MRKIIPKFTSIQIIISICLYVCTSECVTLYYTFYSTNSWTFQTLTHVFTIWNVFQTELNAIVVNALYFANMKTGPYVIGYNGRFTIQYTYRDGPSTCMIVTGMVTIFRTQNCQGQAIIKQTPCHVHRNIESVTICPRPYLQTNTSRNGSDRDVVSPKSYF